MFFSPNPDYTYFSDLMIRSSESVKIPEIRMQYSLKLLPDTNFKTEIQDMSRKFRTFGNPSLLIAYIIVMDLAIASNEA